ncbi:MAG: hypothetical protein JWO83_4769 [Caulobacteraceae bacterium]|jgi:hypothetical protein|nr:hypothetical protein [Caulobacteraceae bacterium]
MPVILSKTVFAALASTAAIVGAAPAWAAPSPVFVAFASVCATPAADFTAVRSAADAHGWGETDVKADANMPNVTVADQLTRSSTADKTGLVLSAWHGATKSGVKVSDCTVHVAKSDFATMRDEAAAWLAFTAQENTPKKAIYRFTDTGGAHHALAAGEYDAAAGGAGMEILTVSADANGTVLDLMMIKK